MSELIFACPNCRREISCDPAWAGQQVQCPLCQAAVLIPPTAPQSRLARGPVSAGGDAGRFKPVYRQFNEPKQKKGGELLKWLAFLVGLGAVGVGGYHGYNWYMGKQQQTARDLAPAQASPDVPAEAAAMAADPSGAVPAENKEAPVVPAEWTLDLEAAKIPDGPANGSISGTNFVANAARFEFVGTAYMLSLREGEGASPDRELRVFLRPQPGQPLTNQTWTVTKEMKGRGVPQVAKVWRTDPRYAPRQKTFSSGYAMKLELGAMGDEGITGKIFVALPDTEKSVVAGTFKAALLLPGVGSPAMVTPPTGVNPEMSVNPEFQKRYGITP